MKKGLHQPRQADEETGEQRLRGSATLTISVPCHHPTESQGSTLVGKGRAAPPTISLPHLGPKGSSKYPTAMENGTSTTPPYLYPIMTIQTTRRCPQPGAKESHTTHRTYNASRSKGQLEGAHNHGQWECQSTCHLCTMSWSHKQLE